MLKLAGVIAVFELVNSLLKALVVLFQKPGALASVSVLACHCAVEVCTRVCIGKPAQCCYCQHYVTVRQRCRWVHSTKVSVGVVLRLAVPAPADASAARLTTTWSVA